MHILYHNCPSQRTLVVTHSNQALNDLFTKVGPAGHVCVCVREGGARGRSCTKSQSLVAKERRRCLAGVDPPPPSPAPSKPAVK